MQKTTKGLADLAKKDWRDRLRRETQANMTAIMQNVKLPAGRIAKATILQTQIKVAKRVLPDQEKVGFAVAVLKLHGYTVEVQEESLLFARMSGDIHAADPVMERQAIAAYRRGDTSTTKQLLNKLEKRKIV